MAATAKTFYDALLLDVILPGVHQRYKNKSVFLKRIERTDRDIRGKKIIFQIEVQGEQGMGATARGGTYPTASEAKYIESQVDVKRNYAEITAYGEDFIMSEKGWQNREAHMPLMAKKGASLIENFAIDMARQAWSKGDGELGKVDGAQSSVTTIKVKDVKYFRRGQIVDIHEGSVIEDRTINSVSRKHTTITISGAAVNVTDNTVISRANAKEYEMLGMQAAIDDGDILDEYENIKRTEFEEWASYVQKGEGAPFSLTSLDEMFTRQINDYDGHPDRCYMDADTLLSIVYLQKLKKTDMTPTKIELGYEAPTYMTPGGPVPLVIDPDIPGLGFYSVQHSTVSLRRPRPPHWVEGVMGYWMPTSTSDTYYAHLRYLSEIFVEEAWRNAKYTGYTSAVST